MSQIFYRRLFGSVRLFFAANPTPPDIAILVTGSLAAIASGVPFPIIGILSAN